MTDKAEEKIKVLEDNFVKYGAKPLPELNAKFQAELGFRVTFEFEGNYYRADVIDLEGEEYITIGGTDDESFANVGVTDDVAIFPITYSDEKIEKEVRFLFGVEPYPETYPDFG